MKAGPVLDIDVGNSRVKWRYTHGRAVQRGSFARASGWVASNFPEQLDPSHIRVGSVAGPEQDHSLARCLVARFGVRPKFAKSTLRRGGVTCGYSEPEKMGVDRWLAMLGGWQALGGAFVVMDMGTAATLDFVDAGGLHRGGFIVPGPTTMIAALTANTARVRVDAAVQEPSISPGLDTEACVRHGVCQMFVDWGERSIDRFRRDYDHRAILILTGGAAGLVSPHLNVDFRYEPEIVLNGLAVAIP